MKYEKETLRNTLQQTVGTVVFTKNDGSERTMKCTLKSELLPVVEIKESTKVKADNPEILSVWDVESQGWRSFRIDSIISVDVTL